MVSKSVYSSQSCVYVEVPLMLNVSASIQFALMRSQGQKKPVFLAFEACSIPGL
jgi:hypothetical protein